MAVIREFLVALGYTVNRTQQSQFNRALGQSTVGFATLAGTATATAAAVTLALTKISSGLDDLYFASVRTKSTAENLAAVGYAARQTGSSFDAAAGSVDNLASKLRRMPGLRSMLANMGVDPSGDRTKIMQQLYEKFRHKPDYIQLQIADLFGIDERTWLGLKDAGKFMTERLNMSRTIGVDMNNAARAANNLWTSIRRLLSAIELLLAKFFDAHGDSLAALVDKLTSFLIKLSKAIETVGKWFVQTSDPITNWAKGITIGLAAVLAGMLALPAALRAVSAAWGLLNTVFLSTPLGRLLLIVTTLTLLIDDYMTFLRKGQGPNGSLYNWDSIFSKLKEWFTKIRDFVGDMFDDLVTNLSRALRVSFEWLYDLVEKARGLFRSSDTSSGQKPGGSSVIGSTKSENAQTIIRQMAAAGYTRAQIAAVLASADAESSFDHTRVGDGGKAYGLFQWHPDRQADFKEWAGKDIRDSTADEQIRFFLYEISRGKESGNARNFFVRSNTAARNAQILTEQVLRPSKAFLRGQGRGQVATRLEEELRQGVIGPSRPYEAAGGEGGTEGLAISQTNYYNITGSNAGEIASRVERAHERTNADLIRNARGVVR